MDNLSDNLLGRLRDLVDLPDLTGTKYRMIRPVASGGMGSVYLVSDTELKREVALKVLTTPLDSESLHTRMVREAQIIAMLEHPAIVPIHDLGRLPDGRPFYIMKYVQGETLLSFAAKTPSLTDRLTVLQKLCQAIGFAHSRGVIHRDLKPENIMVGSFGEVLVMDWGTARVNAISPDETPTSLSSLLHHKTGEGAVIGTLSYISPEQAAGEQSRIDHRTDVFGLGAILYYLLTRRPLYTSGNSDALKRAAAAGEFVPPATIHSSIPKRLAAVCHKALAKEPSHRYQTAQEVESDLARFLAGEPVSAYRENIFERANRWLSRNRFVVYMVFAYIILRIIIFFWLGR
jgi:serine/threonine protein kinase